jgi:hypothetical protein
MSILFVNGHHPVSDKSLQDGMPRRLPHALYVDAVLVTNDRAFGMVADLQIEDWTE